MSKRIYETLAELKSKYKTEINRLQATGELDKILKEVNIEELFKNELIEFFNLLVNKEFNHQPALRKEFLCISDLIHLFNNYDYILSKYLNNDNCIGSLPVFVIEAAKKFDIDVYKDITYDEMYALLDDRLDLRVSYSPIYGRNFINPPSIGENECYDAYFDTDLDNIDYYNKEEFYVAAEVFAFLDECGDFGFEDGSIIHMTAKLLGDGYGYDVYCYDPINKKEKLIEVKSTRSWEFELTENEIRIMRKTRKQPDTDYYMYIYEYERFDKAGYEVDRLNKIVLKYNKENDYFDTISITLDINDKKRKSIELDPNSESSPYKKIYNIEDFVRSEENKQLIR